MFRKIRHAQDTSSRSTRLYVTALIALLLAACSSGVHRAPDAGLQQPQFDDPGEKAGSLTVNMLRGALMDPEYRTLPASNLKDIFSQGRFRQTIHRILELHDLIADQSDAAFPTIEVTVTLVRVRPTIEAMIFGVMVPWAGYDNIQGIVLVRAPEGGKLQEFSVSASNAYGSFVFGDETRMNWLYESFAELMTEELSGRTEY